MRNQCLSFFFVLCTFGSVAQIQSEDEFFQPTVKHRVTQDESVHASRVTRMRTMSATESVHQVDFVLTFNEVNQSAQQIYLVNSETELANESFGIRLAKGSNVMPIPEGVYDIVTTFRTVDPMRNMPLYNMYVILEQVEINCDMQLNISADDAKNHIHFQTLTIDGEPVYTGKFTIDENWNTVPVEEGNTDDVFFHNKIVCSDYGEVHRSSGNFGVVVESEFYNNPGNEAAADFYVNDVSDRYSFYSHRVALNGCDVYSSSYVAEGASGNVEISNNPSDFVLFEELFSQPRHNGERLYLMCSFTERSTEKFEERATEIVNTTPIKDGDTFKTYLSKSEAKYVSLVQPGTAFGSVTETPWGDDVQLIPAMISMPLINQEGEILFANNGTGSYVFYQGPDFSNTFLNDEIIIQQNWPTHPAFSYTVDKKSGQYGNNCPVLVSNPQLIGNNLVLDFDHIGRYGEKNRDNTLSQVRMSIDGGHFYSGQGASIIPIEENSGVIDASIVNENVFVDDISGSNKSYLHYLIGAEDQNPPTVTMLHFKDNEDNVTDRFASAANGSLEFSGGDFNFIMMTPDEKFAYNYQAPQAVVVEYAPYGTEDWNELTIEELPEYFWPVMGGFYRGSLAGVTGQGLNGWFDLKIRLTDAAGNWQEQVLSPAFRIDDLAYTSVATVGSGNAHEVARYNLAGQRVDASHQGVTIIKMSDGTARKVIN